MGRASRGGSCPLCRNYASTTATGKLYRHRGDVPRLIGAGNMECRASGATPEVAQRLRANRDAGRHAHRCEDGAWLYVCGKCGREAKRWPLERGGKCAPGDWAHCIRPATQLERIKEARNEE